MVGGVAQRGGELVAVEVAADRDAKFTAAFDAVLAASGVRIIKTPVRAAGARSCGKVRAHRPGPRSPTRCSSSANGILRTILAEYEAHYNGRRPHRSRQLRPPRPDHPVADLTN